MIKSKLLDKNSFEKEISKKININKNIRSIGINFFPEFKNNKIKNNLLKKYNTLNDLYLASKIHKNVRKDIKNILYPGNSLKDISNKFDELILKYSKSNIYKNQINNCLGFPVTISINDCIAHNSLLPNQDIIIDKNDIIKFDFGTHFNKWIIDSAFTISWNPKFEILHTAVHESIMECIKNAKPDARMTDLGNIINEVMSSYQIEIDNILYDITPITKLGGHNILNGRIHGGKFLPSYFNYDRTKMKEGEVYAIETFGICVTDKNEAKTIESKEIFDNLYTIPIYDNKNKIIKSLFEQFNTLPFSDNWIKKYTNTNLQLFKHNLDKLKNKGLINSYPPLYSLSKFNCQYEHTIFITDFGNINLSQSSDY